VEDKLKARTEYIDAEKIVGQNTLLTDDPVLQQAFNRKGKSASVSVHNKQIVKPNVAAYAIKTDSLQTLTMVNGASTSFQTLSLWRSKPNLEFTQQDEAVANIILPHVFQAFSIHRKLHLQSENAPADTALAICTVAGQIRFMDDAAIYFLQTEFHVWRPLFLPASLFEILRMSSENFLLESILR